jgi:hypothetical protein
MEFTLKKVYPFLILLSQDLMELNKIKKKLTNTPMILKPLELLEKPLLPLELESPYLTVLILEEKTNLHQVMMKNLKFIKLKKIKKKKAKPKVNKKIMKIKMD